MCVCVCITGTGENSFLVQTQEATAWAEVKTTTLSKANPSEVLPLETETLPADCVSVSNTFLNNSVIVYNAFLKSAGGIKKIKLETMEFPELANKPKQAIHKCILLGVLELWWCYPQQLDWRYYITTAYKMDNQLSAEEGPYTHELY